MYSSIKTYYPWKPQCLPEDYVNKTSIITIQIELTEPARCLLFETISISSRFRSFGKYCIDSKKGMSLQVSSSGMTKAFLWNDYEGGPVSSKTALYTQGQLLMPLLQSKDPIRRFRNRNSPKSSKFRKLYWVYKNRTIQTPSPKLERMVSSWWIINVLPNEKKNDLASMMFLN